jgi:hypothetical protein
MDEINTRTRFGAAEHFVVNGNTVKETWFELGVEPEDSWRKTQAREAEAKNASQGAADSGGPASGV